jgi:ABC-2 type transport system permease protein
LKNGLNGHDSAEQRAASLKAALLKKYNVKSVEALPVSYQGISLQAGEEHGNKVFDHYYSELWDTFQRQEHVHQAASIVAPMLAVRSLSMSLAGTDFAQHAHFPRAAEDYRRVIQRLMNGDLTDNGKTAPGVYMRGRDLWQRVPDFDYQTPPLGWVLDRQMFSLLLVFLWAAAAALWAWRATQRLRVD